MNEVPLWKMGNCPSCGKKLTFRDRANKLCHDCGKDFKIKAPSKILVAFSILILIGLTYKACSTPADPSKKAAEERAEIAHKAAEEKSMAEKVAEEKANEETSQFEIDLALFCEKNVRKKLAIPRSASFDAGTESRTFKPAKDKKSANAVLYEEFSYKNSFNAELTGAFVCEVDVRGWKENRALSLVSLKIGRPYER
jgi:hypothetical protein